MCIDVFWDSSSTPQKSSLARKRSAGSKTALSLTPPPRLISCLLVAFDRARNSAAEDLLFRHVEQGRVVGPVLQEMPLHRGSAPQAISRNKQLRLLLRHRRHDPAMPHSCRLRRWYLWIPQLRHG